MAKVNGLNKITGTIQGVTYYTIMGSDQVYLRQAGGPSKSMIKRSDKFVNVRMNNEEWKGCTKMGRGIREALLICKNVTDYPVSGALNALAKRIQKTDTENTKGKRSLLLSRNKEVVIGFCVSKKEVPETILRVPVKFSIDREAFTAMVSMPAINPELHLYNFRNLPYFRVLFQLCAVSDMIYNEQLNDYVLATKWGYQTSMAYESPWYMTNNVVPALEASITLKHYAEQNPIPDSITLVLSYCIEFGKPGPDNSPQEVKYAGTGKVMGTA